MKKLTVILMLACFTLVSSAQLFKPVTAFPTKVENEKKVSLGEEVITQKWLWRLDASIAIVELNYNKVDKQFIASTFNAVGPAIGYQHYVPSADGVTPFNNYGFSAALLLGENIYNPQLASLKFALVANVMQYFKLGITVTPKPSEGISTVGCFFGGGITF